MKKAVCILALFAIFFFGPKADANEVIYPDHVLLKFKSGEAREIFASESLFDFIGGSEEAGFVFKIPGGLEAGEALAVLEADPDVSEASIYVEFEAEREKENDTRSYVPSITRSHTDIPEVIHNGFSSIGKDSAVVHAVIYPKGEDTYCYGMIGRSSTYSDYSDTVYVGFSYPFEMAIKWSGLSQNTTYHTGFYAYDYYGGSWSEDWSFRTDRSHGGGGGGGCFIGSFY